MTQASITSGQEQQLVRLFEDGGRWAIGIVEEKFGLTTEEWQRVLERGDDLRSKWPELIRDLVRGRYVDEEVKSSYGYLSGYTKPIAISDQIDILRQHWPNLNPDPALRYAREVYPTRKLPDWVEGPFAVIRPGFFYDAYGEELEEVLKALSKSRDGKLYNYCEGELGPKYLRQSEHTLKSTQHLVEQQPNSDILISAAQFGIRHRGRSVRRAREMFKVNEYGQGAKNVGIMILTHPSRLQHYDDLWIDCAGDEYAPGADGDFVSAPYFRFYAGVVEFDTDDVGNAYDYYGSSSAV